MENMATQVLVNFFEGSYQYRSVEVSDKGSVTDLFDAISKEFNNLHNYRRTQNTLWADIINVIDGQRIKVFRVKELTPSMVEVSEFTQGVGFTPTDDIQKWKHVTVHPKELDIVKEF